MVAMLGGMAGQSPTPGGLLSMRCSHKPEELVLELFWFQIKTSMYMDAGLQVACTVLRPVLWSLSPHTPKWVGPEGAQVCNVQIHTAVHGYAWTSPGVHSCTRCMWMTFLLSGLPGAGFPGPCRWPALGSHPAPPCSPHRCCSRPGSGRWLTPRGCAHYTEKASLCPGNRCHPCPHGQGA